MASHFIGDPRQTDNQLNPHKKSQEQVGLQNVTALGCVGRCLAWSPALARLAGHWSHARGLASHW